jgi:hypothetical protein
MTQASQITRRLLTVALAALSLCATTTHAQVRAKIGHAMPRRIRRRWR